MFWHVHFKVGQVAEVSIFVAVDRSWSVILSVVITSALTLEQGPREEIEGNQAHIPDSKGWCND